MDKMNFFAETSEDDKMRQEDKEFFIQYNHVECGGDKAIIEFIANFRFFAVRDVEYVQSSATICSMFENGYYFAKILEDVFPGGTICLCYPYGHIVYVYREVAYDIGGVSDAEAERYVPLSMVIEAGVRVYKRLPGPAIVLTKFEKNAIEHLCGETGVVYALSDCLPCRQIVQRCRGIVFGSDDPEIRKQQEALESLRKELLAGGKSIDFGQKMTAYCIENKLSWEFIKTLHSEYREQQRKEARRR